jgi:hypothetical protein
VACAEVPSDQSRSGRIPLARRRRTSHRRIVSVWDRRFEVPRTSRFLRQGGGAGESAQAILCHDRRPRSPAFGGRAPRRDRDRRRGIFVRHRRTGTHQHVHRAIRPHSEQAETEPSAKVPKPRVAWTPLLARRVASGEPNFVVCGSAIDPCKMSSRLKVSLSSPITTIGGSSPLNPTDRSLRFRL